MQLWHGLPRPPASPKGGSAGVDISILIEKRTRLLWVTFYFSLVHSICVNGFSWQLHRTRSLALCFLQHTQNTRAKPPAPPHSHARRRLLQASRVTQPAAPPCPGLFTEHRDLPTGGTRELAGCGKGGIVLKQMHLRCLPPPPTQSVFIHKIVHIK